MALIDLLLYLLIAGVCGSVAQSLVGYTRGGCLASILLGFVGALIGTWIARAVGLHEMLAVTVGDRTFPVVWSIIGAVLFVAGLNLLTPRSKRTARRRK